MKKFLTSVAMVLLFAGCTNTYDDSGIKARLDAIETKLTALEGNIQSMQSAIGDGVFVAKVQEYADPETGKTTGVTVTYTSGDVKYFTISPKADFDAPVLGVIKDGAGDLVWAIDGIALQMDGKSVPVYQTPVFSIDDDGNLLVAIDDSDPVVLGQVQSGGATLVDGIFTDIKVEQDKVVLTLSDETKVNVPFAEAFKLNIETTELSFSALDPIEIPYTVSAKTANTVVGVAGYSPKEFSVAVEADKIVVTPLSPKAAGILLAYADSRIGLTSLVNITIEAEGLEVTDEPFSAEVDYMAEGEDAVVVANVVSNIDFDVKPVDEWIHVVSVKSQAYVITLSLDDNTTGEVRVGTVNIFKKGTETLVETITIAQAAAEIEAGPANLSKKESANSYIVTAAGEYQFKAVKGNSSESVGDVAKAVILWETEYTETAPEANSIIASVSYADGVISFATPDELKPGAAVIVAKDAGDAVLWNWLIWIPKTPISHIEDAAFFGLPVMDRNLGALDKATTAAAGRETYGMYYQWGRNNPLPGFAKTTAEITKEDGPKSTAYSIANPTVFIKVSESDSDGNWNEANVEDLWEDASGNKAIFDPCPPGYKVPSYNDATGLWTNGNDGWAYNWAANNYTFGDIVFPMAGWYSSSASVGYEGARSIILSATAHSAPRARLKIVRQDKDGFYYANYFKQEAASVRCVVVDAGATVPPTPNSGSGSGSEPTDDSADLSKDGSANCYLVTAAGDYKFKAVKGNTSDAVGTVAKAEIIWETENTATAPEANSIIAQVGVDGEYITFSTPATLKAGNALIAAKDASDVILWSWHIWIPSAAVSAADFTDFIGGKMMNMNLGALEPVPATGSATIESLGLLYQWGRKDPFVGAAAWDKYPAKAAVTPETAVWTKSEGKVSMDEAIKNPTVLYIDDAHSDDHDWNSTSEATLWDNGGKKAIYDPCPVGYKVPVKAGAIWTKSDDGWNFDVENHVCEYTSAGVRIPLAGYVECYGGSLYASGGGDDHTYLWSATSHDDGRGECMYIRTAKDPGSRYYKAYRGKGNAASVRCIAE